MEKESVKDRKRLKILKIAAGVLLLGNILVWAAVFDISRRDVLEVDFFDVGQGDAALIIAPGGKEALIDGGPGPAVLEGLGKALPFWDRSIELVILTHPDHDHLAGLLEVLKNYEVKNILWSGVPKSGAEFDEWEKLIVEERANIVKAEAGQIISLDKKGRSNIEIIHSGGDPGDVNNTSVVAKLSYGERSFLFCGDIGREVEEKLAAGNSDLRADVLKIPHHGSKTSASEIFLSKVNPAAAVISVGQGNSYGHPGSAILELSDKYDIKIFRTDTDGDIFFATDGNKLYTKE